MRTERVTLPILGLTCGGGGALTVERLLARAPGVEQAYVNPLTEMAYVEYDPLVTSPQLLTEAVRQAGFRAGPPCVR
jgi:cation transport ATPase